jgi:hypothetical protein
LEFLVLLKGRGFEGQVLVVAAKGELFSYIGTNLSVELRKPEQCALLMLSKFNPRWLFAGGI